MEVSVDGGGGIGREGSILLYIALFLFHLLQLFLFN